MEQQFLYFPDREIVLTPERYGLPFEEVNFSADDSMKLHGWFVPGGDGQPVILFFHGNAGNISHRIENIWFFHLLGFGVFIFDYRGYGKSEGSPSEEGLARDARAAREWLGKRGFVPERTVYFGRSLGAAVALQLALEVTPLALVLESPFTSIRELGKRHYPLMHAVFGWLLSDRYANIDKISNYRGPLLIFQGGRDSIVPETMARRLFAAANEPKRFHLIPGADHNNTYEVGGEEYWQLWYDFINDLQKPSVREAASPGGPGGTR